MPRTMNDMPSGGARDGFVKRMVTTVAADLASPHGVCIGVGVSSAIRIPVGAVHHNMDVVAIASNDFSVDLESYLKWKLSEKRGSRLTFCTVGRLAESTSEL